MIWLDQIRRRLAVLFHRDRFARDLEEEMQSHLEFQAEEYAQNGMRPEEAGAAARRQFGNPALLNETSADVWGWAAIDRLRQDLRYAFRMLRKNPGFAAVAVLSLAIGIGANTAIFTVVNAVLLKTLPVRDPGRLIIAESVADTPIKGVWSKNSNDRLIPGTNRRMRNTFPLAALRDFRAKASDTARMFVFFSCDAARASDEFGNGLAHVTLVSGDFFDGIGAPIELGRGLTDEDDRTGASAIVITDRYWRNALNRDAAVLGRTLRLNGAPMTIVGVAGPRFHGVSAVGFNGPADVFAPLSTLDRIDPDEFRVSDRPKTAPNYWWVQMMGRLQPGVTMEAASERLTAVWRGMFAASGVLELQAAVNPRIILTHGDKGLNGLREGRNGLREPLLILMVVVGIVLLLACVNLASLQLARSAARRREIAVRLSLGASRGRIVRQLLIEGMLLSLVGAVAGALFAIPAAPLIARLLTVGPFFDNVSIDLSPDLGVFSFTLAAVVATTALFGLIPALRATRVDIAPALKDNTHATLRRGSLALGHLLIGVQAALSLVLLAGSGLLLHTLGNLYNMDIGVARDRLLYFGVKPGTLTGKPERLSPLFDSVLASVSSLPGVRSAAELSHRPIGGWNNSTMLSTAETNWQPVDTHMNTVSPGYFTTVGMPLVAGRTFEAHDASSARQMVIINQTAARTFFGDRQAVGQALRRHMGNRVVPVEVIGVARDAKFNSMRAPIQPTMFIPFPNDYPWGRDFAVRTTGDPRAMAGPIARAVAAVSPDLLVKDIKTQDELIDVSLHQERLFATLLTVFGVFALILAAIGLHGVTAYATARRTPEIGLRMALGAGRGAVLRVVLGQALRPVAIGCVVGFAASWAATRWIESMLYGVQRLDPLALAGAFALLAAVALAAALAPAWRAVRIDPTTALRSE